MRRGVSALSETYRSPGRRTGFLVNFSESGSQQTEELAGETESRRWGTCDYNTDKPSSPLPPPTSTPPGGRKTLLIPCSMSMPRK